MPETATIWTICSLEVAYSEDQWCSILLRIMGHKIYTSTEDYWFYKDDLFWNILIVAYSEDD